MYGAFNEAASLRYHWLPLLSHPTLLVFTGAPMSSDTSPGIETSSCLMDAMNHRITCPALPPTTSYPTGTCWSQRRRVVRCSQDHLQGATKSAHRITAAVARLSAI